MSVELQTATKLIFLVGEANHQITGAKLPSNRQVLAVLFFNICEVILTVSESANLVISECIISGTKRKNTHKIISKLCQEIVDLYHVWRELQKNSMKSQEIHKQRAETFPNGLGYIYLISHTLMPSKE